MVVALPEAVVDVGPRRPPGHASRHRWGAAPVGQFFAPLVLPDDSGQRTEGNQHLVDLEVVETNQRGETCAPGKATVALPAREA